MNSFNKRTTCAAVVLLALWAVRPAQATDVSPGIDLFVTALSPDSYIDFAIEGPIPADFFYIGSNAFSGTVILEGKPLGQCGGPPLPPEVDTIVRRLTAASPLPVGGSDIVDIQMVALSLRGFLQVTGTNPVETWSADVCLRPGVTQPTTQMTINHEVANGGTFSATVTIAARLTFTRLSDGTTRTLDDTFTFTGTPGSWAHTTSDPRIDAAVGVGVQLDADCNGACDAALTVGTSNFIPGVDPQTGKKTVAPMAHVTPGERHYTDPPQRPAKIPTVSEWGMVVVLLVMLSAGTIMFGFRKPAVTGADGSTAGFEVHRSTFVPSVFGPVLAIVLAATVALLAGAMLIFGPLGAVDIGGAFVSAVVLSYLIHLWVLLRRS